MTQEKINETYFAVKQLHRPCRIHLSFFDVKKLAESRPGHPNTSGKLKSEWMKSYTNSSIDGIKHV